MSRYIFIASDFQIEDVENTHIQYYSVNEALAKGIEVPELVLSSETIDRNKPGVLLWIDDEKNFGEISIKAFDKSEYENKYTSLKYCSNVMWEYSDNRAKRLIQYIKKHFEIADYVEIWNVWNGNIKNEPTPQRYTVRLCDLVPADFEKMLEFDFYCIEVMCNL